MPTSLADDILASGLIQGAFACALESPNRDRASSFSTWQPGQTEPGSQVLRDVARHMLTWLVMRSAASPRRSRRQMTRDLPNDRVLDRRIRPKIARNNKNVGDS